MPDDLNVEFNQLGAAGWELVGVEAITRPTLFLSGSRTIGMVGFFKRRRPE